MNLNIFIKFYCPFYKSNKQWIRHWLINFSFYNHISSKVHGKILFLYNAFNRDNLTNVNINSNNDNSNSNNSYSNNSYSNNSYNNISNSSISMLAILLKIMCILILMCVKKCLISFLGEEVLITV